MNQTAKPTEKEALFERWEVSASDYWDRPQEAPTGEQILEDRYSRAF